VELLSIGHLKMKDESILPQAREYLFKAKGGEKSMGEGAYRQEKSPLPVGCIVKGYRLYG
jgi:hypothetical protein